MRLVAKAVLWLHVSLYRLTNGRLGGRFIAGSPILLLTTTGRKTGKRRTRPRPLSATASALCGALQRRLGHPSRLIPQPICQRPGRDPGRCRAPGRRGQDRRPGRAPSAVPSLCRNVQGLRGL